MTYYKRIRIDFQDGSETIGYTTPTHWERLMDGKLQAFPVWTQEPAHPVEHDCVVRWWAVKQITLVPK
jgi:hypothetical protein